MAFITTVIFQGTNLFVAEIEANADSDANLAIPHGLGVSPAIVVLTPLREQATQLSLWAAVGIDATNISVLKQTPPGSGIFQVQLRVIASVPHSLFL